MPQILTSKRTIMGAMRRLMMLAALVVFSVTISAQAPASEAVRPFKIQIPDAVLADLQARLATARFPASRTANALSGTPKRSARRP